ncbi:MAG: hypothetical protein FK734_19405 [Asgard group archaeon]|nr:hypothetical protein [Asgard group archaeon]
MTRKHKVICFSGSIASGKSSLIKELTNLLDESAVIKFDDYEQFITYPENLPQWIKDGADVTIIKNQRMLADIQKLIADKSIINPLTKEKIKSAKYILVEDPFGNLRNEFAQLYDFLVFIEIPLDISLARLIKRMINEVSITDENSVDFNKLVNQISNFLDKYINFQRDLYQIAYSRVKPNANLLLDGQKTLDSLAKEVLSKIL